MLHRKLVTNYPAKHAKFGKFSEGNYSLFCRKSMCQSGGGVGLECALRERGKVKTPEIGVVGGKNARGKV